MYNDLVMWWLLTDPFNEFKENEYDDEEEREAEEDDDYFEIK